MFGRRKARDHAKAEDQEAPQERTAGQGPVDDELPPLEPMRPAPGFSSVENAFLGWNPSSSTSDSLKPHRDPSKERIYEDEIDPS
jgi:hypothetical protein